MAHQHATAVVVTAANTDNASRHRGGSSTSDQTDADSDAELISLQNCLDRCRSSPLFLGSSSNDAEQPPLPSPSWQTLSALVDVLRELRSHLHLLSRRQRQLRPSSSTTTAAGASYDESRFEAVSVLLRFDLPLPSRYSVGDAFEADTRIDDEDCFIARDLVDECLDLCGGRSCLDAARFTLRSAASASTSNSERTETVEEADDGHRHRFRRRRTEIQEAARLVRRIVLSLSHRDDEEDDVRNCAGGDGAGNEEEENGGSSSDDAEHTTHAARRCCPLSDLALEIFESAASSSKPSPSSTMSESAKRAMDDLTQDIVRIPILLSAVCQSAQLALPRWAIPSLYGPRSVRCAWDAALLDAVECGSSSSVWTMDVAAASAAYLKSLVRSHVGRGDADAVAIGTRGCYDHWCCGVGGDDDDDDDDDEEEGEERGGGKYLARCRDAFRTLLRDAVGTLRSPRERDVLLRSVLLHATAIAIASSVSSYTDRDRKWSGRDVDAILLESSSSSSSHRDGGGGAAAMSYLRDAVLPALEFVPGAREGLVRSVVLSRHSSSSSSSRWSSFAVGSGTAAALSERAVPRCLALLLHACRIDVDGDESDSDSDSEDDSAVNAPSNETKDAVLLRGLRQVTSAWSEPIFVSKTDAPDQRRATEFVLCSLGLMGRAKDLHSSSLGREVVTDLVRGVSVRLNSSLDAIRTDGMRVAEALAPLVGAQEALRFEELDGTRDEKIEDVEEKKEKPRDVGGARDAGNGKHRKNEQAKKNKPRRRARARRGRAGSVLSMPVDPDAEYFSESDDEESLASYDTYVTQSSTSSASNDEEVIASDDSVWDEDGLIPYDLDDDEEDLREVPRPCYLRDCLDLLRAADDDRSALYKHEAALMEIARLIRASPADLPDVAPVLAKELLYIEDKFNLDGFLCLRRDGLVALAVHEPVSVARCLIGEMFGAVALTARLEILDVLGCAAEELCGATELKNIREERGESVVSAPLKQRVSGKRRLVAEQQAENRADRTTDLVARTIDLVEAKTRRWGRGSSQRVERTVTNKFGPLAPLFFYPLVGGFAESKHDTSIWGGANGARLMASLLVALSSFVECSGSQSGTVVLATDLFELAWSFRDAESTEVRMAVLVAIATCVVFLPFDFIVRTLYEADSLPEFLRRAALEDSDKNCRSLALSVATSVSSALKGLESSSGGSAL